MTIFFRVCQRSQTIDGSLNLRRVFRKCMCFFGPLSRHINSISGTHSGSDGDVIYQAFKNEDGNVPVAKFIAALKEAGFRVKDPRLQETMANFAQYLQQEHFEGFVDEKTFRRSIQKNIVLIEKALCGDSVIPEFSQFTKHIEEIYQKCKPNSEGKVADYIPQLAKFDPNLWGMAVCSVDGQRFSIGDDKVHFCLQSVSKCLHYPIVLEDLTAEVVHRYVGREPSGQTFNYLHLNSQDQPHNPMLNSGALLLCALQKPEWPLADRYEYVQDKFKHIAGGEFIGFSNSTFLSERETADKNYALGYYMNAHKAFPLTPILWTLLNCIFILARQKLTAMLVVLWQQPWQMVEFVP